ncbi:MAG: hypothetical protein LM568_03830 [Desulfurococcaceae archaeon]|nr:hypothetical protein [Desulfurococcaceae archaeon]
MNIDVPRFSRILAIKLSTIAPAMKRIINAKTIFLIASSTGIRDLHPSEDYAMEDFLTFRLTLQIV